MTIRKSVPTKGVSEWWLVGWLYVMPDFDRPDHSVIEWIGFEEPIEPSPVSENHRVPPQIEGTAEAV